MGLTSPLHGGNGGYPLGNSSPTTPTPIKDWVGEIGAFANLGWDTPIKIAQISFDTLSARIPDGPSKLFAIELWEDATLSFADTPSAAILTLHGASDDAEKLIARQRRASLCRRAITSDIKTAANENCPRANFSKLGPDAKLKVLKKANLPQCTLNRFPHTTSHGIALAGIRRCFDSFASAIRCYYSFCELRSCIPFPARERTILERITVFNPGATFSNYVGYIRKACPPPHEPLSWDPDAVANTVVVLKPQGAGKYRFPNFIRVDFIVRILIRDSMDSPFAQLAYISFLYAPRVPSEALILRRAFKNDDLTSSAPMQAYFLIALRGEQPNECLVLRLARRKNLSHGCILSRPCFCALDDPQAKKLCPAHSIWPAIASRVQPGELLFPGYYSANVNTAVKAVLAKIDIPYAQSNTPHGFRRGEAQELKEKCSQWPIVAGVGLWRSVAFKGYVDTTLDVGRDTSKLLIESEPISDDEDHVLTVCNQTGPGSRPHVGC